MGSCLTTLQGMGRFSIGPKAATVVADFMVFTPIITGTVQDMHSLRHMLWYSFGKFTILILAE